MLTPTELEALVGKCREVPLTSSVYISEDVVLALLETVVEWIGQATSVGGAIAASGGMAIIADEAFPVEGEAVAEPALGVVLLAAGALLLRVNPLSPLLHRSQAAS